MIESIHLDIDPRQIGHVFPLDLAIVSDDKLGLQAVLDTARTMTSAWQPDERVERVDELHSTLLRKMDFDDVPVKPQRAPNEINGSSTKTPSRSRP